MKNIVHLILIIKVVSIFTLIFSNCGSDRPNNPKYNEFIKSVSNLQDSLNNFSDSIIVNNSKLKNNNHSFKAPHLNGQI